MSELSQRVRRGCPEAPRIPYEPSQEKRPVAFLDRDGVINADRGYVHLVADFEWSPGALEAVRLLNENGYIVAIVTNQSGIGRGLYDEEEFLFLTLWMLDEAEKDGAHIDAVYYCPHHPEARVAEYHAACPARKPGTAMLERAQMEFPMDKPRSFVVGNRDSDLEAARAFGIKGYLYQGGDLAALVRRILGA